MNPSEGPCSMAHDGAQIKAPPAPRKWPHPSKKTVSPLQQVSKKESLSSSMNLSLPRHQAYKILEMSVF